MQILYTDPHPIYRLYILYSSRSGHEANCKHYPPIGRFVSFFSISSFSSSWFHFHPTPPPSPARLHRLHRRHLLLLLRLLLLEFIFLINNHSKKEKEHDKKRERERERERGREREGEAQLIQRIIKRRRGRPLQDLEELLQFDHQRPVGLRQVFTEVLFASVDRLSANLLFPSLPIKQKITSPTLIPISHVVQADS